MARGVTTRATRTLLFQSAPHLDPEQLNLSDDAASDTHTSIQERYPNAEVSGTWSADHLAEMQKAKPEI